MVQNGWLLQPYFLKMKSFKLLHQLLTLVEEFEAETSGINGSVEEFMGFLLTRRDKLTPKIISADVRFGDKEEEAQRRAFITENAIGRLFVYMSRYARSYIKIALDGTPLISPDDFTCLAILLTHEELSKKELIEKNMQEKTSGSEVIRRLIAAGLVQQKDGIDDKRTKKVFITQQGRELLYKVFQDMNNVGTIVSGRLTLSEKLMLQHLLQKLEDFHHHLHENNEINAKDDLVKWALLLK